MRCSNRNMYGEELRSGYSRMNHVLLLTRHRETNMANFLTRTRLIIRGSMLF
jgi:hypothetical protein